MIRRLSGLFTCLQTLPFCSAFLSNGRALRGSLFHLSASPQDAFFSQPVSVTTTPFTLAMACDANALVSDALALFLVKFLRMNVQKMPHYVVYRDQAIPHECAIASSLV